MGQEHSLNLLALVEQFMIRRLKCPCIKCCNVYYQDVKTTYDHIIWHGIGKSYTTWFFHGENSTSLSFTQDQTLDDVVEEDDDTTDDMRGMLHDLCGVWSGEEIHDGLRRGTEEDGVEPSHANIFKIAYTHKDSTPSNSVVADALEKMNRQQEKQLEGSREPPGREDVISQVFGEDRSGQCRILEVGPTPSRELGGKSNSQMLKQGEMTCLRSKIAKVEKREKERIREMHDRDAKRDRKMEEALLKHDERIEELKRMFLTSQRSQSQMSKQGEMACFRSKIAKLEEREKERIREMHDRDAKRDRKMEEALLKHDERIEELKRMFLASQRSQRVFP